MLRFFHPTPGVPSALLLAPLVIVMTTRQARTGEGDGGPWQVRPGIASAWVALSSPRAVGFRHAQVTLNSKSISTPLNLGHDSQLKLLTNLLAERDEILGLPDAVLPRQQGPSGLGGDGCTHPLG